VQTLLSVEAFTYLQLLKKFEMTDDENVVYIGVDPNKDLDLFIRKVETTFGCKVPWNQILNIKSDVVSPNEESGQEEKPFKCESCYKSYGSSKNLERHKIEKHGNVSHQCDLCPYKASWPSGLKRHVQLIHNSESCPIQACTECNFTTKYKQSLKEHIQSFHLNQDNFNRECLECKKTFISKRGYTQHMKAIHVKGSTRKNSAQPPDGENHCCSECDYTTKIRSYLLRHFKTVHGTGCFMCDSCGMEYRTKKQLKTHTQDKHSGIIFNCEICTYSSPRYREVLRHKLRVHEKASPDHVCEYCGFVTKYKQTLHDHMQSVHDHKTFSCDDCGYTSKKRRSLVKHKLRCSGQSFPCGKCNDTFLTEKLLRLHERKTHEGREAFKCDECDYIALKKTYLLKHQKLIHGRDSLNINPYPSVPCSSSQSSSINYNSDPTNNMVKHHQSNEMPGMYLLKQELNCEETEKF